ncbi:MAG: hypothetical protein A2622_11970 [Bdellovibrionales bacterium RIFCSPHIGHO2_01_FULL_40_29]|nr:MAG: hypothetical protein A2622_11970 [Bdellovibrionales bacterium RIFCSPHIGHO2_01_FULL_40_29]OFZ35618.1 MAG: hypothetical protein A3D17_00570 [Bdellovibrionales bacterium RIFCSPHIGHO2_02_FULL_40_15]
MQIKSIIPALYNNLLSTKVLNLSAVETKATCQNCLRSRDKRFAYTYKSNLKCCTFHPYLPNFAVGALLSTKEKTVGIEKLESKILSREFALPIGVMAPYDYQLAFLSKNEEDFGNRADLLCPYFSAEQNQCSIWEYRGVVCTSFYCRSDYGQDGQKFWAVMSDFLSYVEMALAEECLVQLDFSPRDLSDQLMYLNKRDFSLSEQTQHQLDEVTDRKLWNGYDSKIEFYQKCFAIVQKLDRNQFKEILGEQGLELESEVVDYGHRR